MTTGKALNGKPYAGNPHVRFDEGEVASAATPRRGSLLYNLRKTMILAAVVASAAIPLAANAATKSARLMLSGYTGTTTLTNFQALVKLNEGRFGFSYDDFATKDGSDLWFTDSSGNVIPHELDTWNASGDSFVWVRVPEVSGTDTQIVMHWGEAKNAAQTATENVWKNYNDGKGGFAGVWHMKVNLGNETDAAGNGLTATRGGNKTSQMTTTSGVVGLCRVNQTELFGSSNGNGLDVSGYGNHITDVARFTLSGWFRATVVRPADIWTQMFSSEKWRARGGQKGQLNIVVSITVNGIEIASPAPSALPGSEGFVDTWCYLVLVFDGTSCRLYANGKSLGSWTDKTAVSEFADFFRIGNVYYGTNRGWYGKYDEVRMYDGAQSEDRVVADYATVKSPDTFVVSADTDPYTATWTGEASDGNAANAANWTCYNVFGDKLPDGTPPTNTTAVTIAGDGIAITASTNAPLVFRAVNVGNCTLGVDCDLRGLGAVTITDGAIVDLNGHVLKVPSFSGTGTITNSVAGDAAELYAYVASGETMQNAETSIGGNLKFVKEGRGTYVAAKTLQTYTGGTLVADGEIQCTARGDRGQFGTSPEVTIDPDGVFDVCGQVVYNNYRFILNGGTLKSSKAIQQSGWTMWGNVRLTADSAIAIYGNYGFATGNYGKTTLDLGGHKLSVSMFNVAHFQLYSTEILNGSIENDSGGYIHSYSNSKNDVGSTTFDFKAAIALHLDRALVVRDYTAVNKWTGSNNGTAVIKVYRTFTPAARSEGCYHSCEMQNGSTMDLSGWPSDKGWPMYSRYTAGGKQLSFANGTVNVKLDITRADVQALAKTKENGTYAGYLLKWGTAAGTLATRNENTVFVLDEVSAQKYRLVSNSTGLLLRPKGGFVILVR